MNLTVLTYLIYFSATIPLTVWVGSALRRYGEVFLSDVFGGDSNLAHAVNQLLVIGFYLLNLGYIALFMTSHAEVGTARRVLEILSTKVGAVALVLGVVHFANVWAFNAFRRRAVLRAKAQPPIQPNGYTAVSAPPAARPSEPQQYTVPFWAPPGAATP